MSSDGLEYMMKRMSEQRGDVISKYTNIEIPIDTDLKQLESLSKRTTNSKIEKNNIKENNIRNELKEVDLLSKFTTIRPKLSDDTRRRKALFLLKAYTSVNTESLILEAQDMNIDLLEECIKELLH
jgi:hypothetical protein